MPNPNSLFPRFQTRSELRKTAQESKQQLFSKRPEEHHRLLVPRQDDNHWSTSSGKYGKDRMSTLVTRRETSRRETDVRRMERHIEYSSMARAMYPKDKRDA